MEEHKFTRTVALLYGVAEIDVMGALRNEAGEQLDYLESKRRPRQRKPTYQEALEIAIERAAVWLEQPCTSIEFPVEGKPLAHLVSSYRKGALFFSVLYYTGREVGGESFCTCGHVGDGSRSQHSGAIGHGSCMVDGCKCEKFTWKEFIKLKSD